MGTNFEFQIIESLPGGTSPQFTVKRRVKQSCSISPFLWRNRTDIPTIYYIPIKSSVKYLGIHIFKESTDSENMNAWKVIQPNRSKQMATHLEPCSV